MFERFGRSWSLVKASASVLKQDKELLLFPLLSTASLLVVMACFALPAFGLAAVDGITRPDGSTSPLAYGLAFLFYVTQYFVIFFFNTALVGAALMRLDGEDPTLRDGLRIATSKFGTILGYAIIAATVGMVLRAIQERVGIIGKIVVGLIGIGWSLATYLVVPVLAARDVGPIEAVKESAQLLKRTWGENVIGQVGIGLAFGFIMMAVIFGGIAVVAMAAFTKSIAVIAMAVVVVLLAIGATALIQSALAGIYAAALYRYATTGEESEGFTADTMKLAFAPKK
jgi:hypothetical protein